MNLLSRRNMIGASVAAAGLARGTPANSAITVGVLGTGNRGTFVSTMMAKNTSARVVALCDVFDEKMEQAKKSIGVENPKLYKDFRQMLASDIDVIIIATPVFLHAEHFEAAVKAGKHIYIGLLSRIYGLIPARGADRACDKGLFPWPGRCGSRTNVWSPLESCC
jgi:myo-inositol 2-dehydrogenase/D-chiro-inositol 1-dehydrogenase